SVYQRRSLTRPCASRKRRPQPAASAPVRPVMRERRVITMLLSSGEPEAVVTGIEVVDLRGIEGDEGLAAGWMCPPPCRTRPELDVAATKKKVRFRAQRLRGGDREFGGTVGVGVHEPYGLRPNADSQALPRDPCGLRQAKR